MKKMTKILLAAGGAALICGGAVMTYLKAQTPMTAQEELTLANLEAMAEVLPPKIDWENPFERPVMKCGLTVYLVCKSQCPFCQAEIIAGDPGGPFYGFAGGKCGNCKQPLQ